MSKESSTGEGLSKKPGPKYRATQSRKRGWRRLFSWKALGLYILGFLVLVTGAVALAFAVIDVPEPNDFSTSESSIVYFDDGQTELGRFGVENREIVNSEDMPATLKQAVIAAEDRSFYENPGFSLSGIARAAWDQVQGNASAGGGSTITQQYVKNYYLTQDQTWSRKLQEFVIAVKIDQDVDKDQILTNYLNTIWFGRGAYGVQTASQAYFGVSVGDLNLAQSAALAAILRSPGNYDPTLGEHNAERFEQRFEYVLNGMVVTGAIDQQTADQTEPPEILPEKQENRFGGPNGYLLMMVRDELRALGFADSEIESGGLRVTTSFDAQAQEAAVRAVDEERPAEDAEGVRVGLAAVRPGDGGVVALYGGPDAVEQSYNDAVDARPQPGSTVKPFTLAAGLEEGQSLYSGFAGNSPYEAEGLGPPVANQGDQSYGGSVDLLQSTARSINTAFVDLTRTVGSAAVVDALVRAGVSEQTPGLDVNPRVTLGIASVSVLEMTEAYATLAAQGLHADPYTVAEVSDPSGTVLYEREIAPERVFDEDVMADVTYALTQVVDGWYGTGQEAQGLGRPTAAKTGTHQELTSWFAGYTPQLAASVAYFRGDGTESLHGVGGQASFPGGGYPARTWTAFMKAALEGAAVQEFPDPAYVNAYTPAAPPASDYTDEEEVDELDDGGGDGDADESEGDESGEDQSGSDDPADESGEDGSGDEDDDQQSDDESGSADGSDQNGGAGEDGDDGSADQDGGEGEAGDDESGDGETGTEDSGDESDGTADGTESGNEESGTDSGDDGTDAGSETGSEDSDTGDDGTATNAPNATAATNPLRHRAGRRVGPSRDRRRRWDHHRVAGRGSPRRSPGAASGPT